MRFFSALYFGILAAAGALAVELLLSGIYFIFTGNELIDFRYLNHLSVTLILFVIVEESFKYKLIARLLLAGREKLSRFAVVRSWLVGGGFAAVELAFISYTAGGAFSELLPNMIYIALLHVLTAGIIGSLVAETKTLTAIRSLSIVFIVSFVHLTYNFLIINQGPFFSFLVLVFFAVLAGLNLYNLAAFGRRRPA